MQGKDAHSFPSVPFFRHHEDQPGETISGLPYLRSLLVLLRSVRSSYKGESTNFDEYHPSSVAVAVLGSNLGEYLQAAISIGYTLSHLIRRQHQFIRCESWSASTGQFESSPLLA
jgi:hypothetical protein